MRPLNSFLSEIKTAGLAATNRYTVFFNPPQIMYGVGFNDTAFQDRMMLFCSQAQLPGMNISTSQSRTFGEVREIPYERLFDNVSLTFYVDSEMKIKAFWDKWINSIQDPTTRTFNFYKNYISDVTIQVQNKYDASTYEVQLFECYPKAVSPIQLAYDQKDQMQLNVSLNYRYWSANRISSNPAQAYQSTPFRFDPRDYIPPFLKNVF